MQNIKSHLLLIGLYIQRFIDHSWRNIFGLPQANKSEITPQLYLGGQYRHIGTYRLKRLGITGIINMRITPYHSPHRISFAKILHLPTTDQHAPTLTQLKKGVQFIQEEIKNGGKVYIHCRLGEGRGPTMTLAYLISTGMTYDDAFSLVKSIRPFINPTTVQIHRLKELEKEYST